MTETTETNDSVFKTVTVDMERLFVAPEKSDTTKIAALLSKCVIPLSLKILDLPEKILAQVQELSKESEALLPVEAVDVYKLANRLNQRITDKALFTESDEILDIFLYEAVKSSDNLINNFVNILMDFCNQIDTIRDQISSEKSFYMSQTLGSEVAVDSSLITVAMQNFVQSLNVTASGMKGYHILALVKVVNEVGEILESDMTMKFYGVSDRTALVNKLGYRILPGQMALNNQINKLIDLIFESEQTTEFKKETIVELFTLTDLVKKNISSIGSTGFKKTSGTTQKTSSVISTPNVTPVKEYEVEIEDKEEEIVIIPGERFERNLINKNVFIKKFPIEVAGKSGVGQVVEILPADVIVPDGKMLQYFQNLPERSYIAESRITSDRLIILADDGEFYVFLNDGDFNNNVTIM